MTNLLISCLAIAELSGLATCRVDFVTGPRITNVSVSVSVTTNVTQWNNEVREPDYSGIVYLTYPPTYPMKVTREATERTETTEVVETRTLKFMWDDVEHSVSRSSVLSRIVKRLVRKDAWAEE